MPQMVNSHYENIVPLIISAKGGGTQSVRVVLTSSKEDRGLLEVYICPSFYCLTVDGT